MHCIPPELLVIIVASMFWKMFPSVAWLGEEVVLFQVGMSCEPLGLRLSSPSPSKPRMCDYYHP